MVGLEVYGDTVRSLAWSLSATTGIRTETPSASTFPDGSQYLTFGAFLQDQWRFDPSWEVVAGLRWSRFGYRTTFRNDPFTGQVREDTFQDVTGSVSLAHAIAPGWRVTSTIGQGFRAPNLDDMVTLRTTNQGVDVPVSGLRPEKSLMAELGLKTLQPWGEGSLFVYGMAISDRIVRKPGTYQGSATLNGLPVFQKQNIGRAQMVGIETDIQGRMNDEWTVFGAAAWTYGENVTDGEPLSKIPPFHGRLGIRYAVPSWWVETFTQFAGRQDRLSASDKTDPRMDPNGTAAWATLNLRGGVEMNENLRLSGGVSNLLDAAYREHGSGLDAPGVNVFFTLTLHY